jgi:hypothetical protein
MHFTVISYLLNYFKTLVHVLMQILFTGVQTVVYVPRFRVQ